MSISLNSFSAFRSTAFIGLGSNLDQPLQQLQRALREIDELPDVELIRVSSFYETAPIGFTAQAMFVNAVAQIETMLSPQQLMRALLEIEASHHRVRTIGAEKNGPRTLDLDLLIFNDWFFREADLTLPHPRMHERAFVIKPLLEIAPDIYIPGHGHARDLIAGLLDQGIRKVDDERAVR
jgi:2-amino-4-hydroxy-6-hydroxymethyldihydropteridine diphosphokinase